MCGGVDVVVLVGDGVGLLGVCRDVVAVCVCVWMTQVAGVWRCGTLFQGCMLCPIQIADVRMLLVGRIYAVMCTCVAGTCVTRCR